MARVLRFSHQVNTKLSMRDYAQLQALCVERQRTVAQLLRESVQALLSQSTPSGSTPQERQREVRRA